MPITLDDQITRKPLLDLSADETPHSDKFKGEQAAKLHLTLGAQSPGYDQLSRSVSSGNDQVYKQMLADQRVLRRQQAQNDILQDVLQNDPANLTPEMMQVVQGLPQTMLESPDISDIIEREYSELYTRTASAALGNDVFDAAMNTDPEGTHDLLDRTERMAYKTNLAKTFIDQNQSELSDQGWGTWGWEFTERLVPFLEWYQKQNQVDTLTSPFLPGNNLEAQFAYLWGLDDPDQFKEQFTAAYQDLKSRNLQVAQSWLEGFFSYGSSDAFIDNAFGVTDIAGLTPTKTLGKALRGVARAARKSPTAVADIATELGDYSTSAAGKVAGRVGSQTDGMLGDIKNAKELEESVPSITAPDMIMAGGSKGDQAAVNRLTESARLRSVQAKGFLDANQVDRLTPEQIVRSRESVLDDYLFRNPSVQKNVIDVEIDRTGNIGNVYTARVMIGHRDGTLFESAQQAKTYADMYLGDVARDLKIEGLPLSPVKPVSGPEPIKVQRVQPPVQVSGPAPAGIEQIGQGFRIVVNRNLDETKLRDFKIETGKKSPSEDAWHNILKLGRTNEVSRFVIGPNELLDEQAVTARSVAVTSSEEMASVITEMAKPFGKLSRKELDQMQDIWSVNRDKEEFYETQGAFEDAFLQRNGRLPTERQSDAYWALVQINDLDLIVRDLDWYKQKARMGIEDISLRVNGEDVSFEGKVLNELPYGDTDYWTLSVVKDGQASSPRRGLGASESQRKEWQKLIDDGYRIIQVADMDFKIVQGEKTKYASHILVKSPKRSSVGVKNVDRKPGGHKSHQFQYYVKDPMLGADNERTLYRGDRTLFGFRTYDEAKKFSEVLNTAKQKLRDKTPDAVQYARDNIPVPTRQLMAMIKSGDFDLRAKSTAVKKGQRTIDAGGLHDAKDVIDLTKNKHNLSNQITGKYAGERSENNIKVLKEESDMKFRVEPAPYLSPLDTLREATNDMISKRAFDDYTLMTRENFLREFGEILEGTREEQLGSGLDLLMNPRFKPGVETTRTAEVSRAKNASRAFNHLMHRGTMIDTQIENFKEKLVGSVMKKFGPRGQEWFEARLASKAPNPGQWVRSAAFDLKLGMFNPVQYLLQANNVINAVAIGGMTGLKSGMSYPLMRLAMMNASPERLAYLGKIAERTGLMRADEFAEGVTLMKRSGFFHVGNDAAYLDDMASAEVRSAGVKKKIDTVRKAGRRPFQEGERVARLTGFMTAYLEKKATKKVLDRRDEADILRRAKLITGNMSRESNAAWQKGHLAVMTQFMGYQARLMEQMLGKQLTGAEKLRLFAGYSLMYGVPVGVGTAVAVVPARDMAVEYALANGWDINHPAFEPFLDGFVASMTEFITGEELNVADRYGPQGISTFRDLWRQDKTAADIMLGAGGGIMIDVAQSSWPVLRGMMSEFSDSPDGYYNLTVDDWLDFFRNASSADSVIRMYQVANYGIWMSKNGHNIIQADLPDAVIAAITGLQPAEIGDSFLAGRVSKAFEEYQTNEQKEIIKEYREAMRMDPGPTRDKMIHRIKTRAQAAFGNDPNKHRQLWKWAADEEMTVDSFFEKYEETLRRKGLPSNGVQ